MVHSRIEYLILFVATAIDTYLANLPIPFVVCLLARCVEVDVGKLLVEVELCTFDTNRR